MTRQLHLKVIAHTFNRYAFTFVARMEGWMGRQNVVSQQSQSHPNPGVLGEDGCKVPPCDPV